MKQSKAFASHLRLNALLCCSAAVLLSACGGNIDDGTGQLGATAAQVTTDTGATAPGAAAATPATPAATPTTDTTVPQADAATVTPSDTTTITPTVPTGEQAADVTTQAFDLNGYDSNPLEPKTEQGEAGAGAPASTADGAPRQLAASVATPATTDYYQD
jgi:hypothetical protein